MTKYQELAYRDRFRSLYNEEFQSWFETLARAFHTPGDFQAIRKTSGDGGLDGFAINSQLVYQVYAPSRISELRDSEQAAKIKADFEKASRTLGGRLKEWIFVHNHPEAKLGQLSARALSEIKGQHPHIRIDVLDINSLWKLLEKLPNTTMEELFGSAKHHKMVDRAIHGLGASTVTDTTTVVFDESYRQDRWHGLPVISAGYSAVAAAIASDYAVTSNSSGYGSVDTLAQNGILILPMPFGTLVDERHYDNIAKWVFRGGRLLLLGLYLMETHHYSNLNNLARRFGFDFSPNLTMPPGRKDFRECVDQAFAFANRDYWIRTNLIAVPVSHPIIEGIATLTITSSCTIDLAGTADLLVSTADSVAVLHARGHKNPEGRLVQVTDYVLDKHAPAPILAALPYGAGKVAGIGSWKIFVNELVEDKHNENMMLFRNLIKWLSWNKVELQDVTPSEPQQ